jgi:hypothetical protein
MKRHFVALKTVIVASALTLTVAGSAAAQGTRTTGREQIPAPAAGQSNGYAVPTANGGVPAGVQGGTQYTTKGGTTYGGTVSGNQNGGYGAYGTVTIPCGRACGN